MRPVLALTALLAACGPGGLLASSDRRIDGASDDSDPDSTSPRMCRAGGDTRVAWIDARDGVEGVWTTASSDDGETWGAPIRVDHGTKGARALTMGCAGDHVVLAWEDLRDGQLDAPNVYVNASSDGGATWQGADQRLGEDVDGERQSRGPEVVVAGDRAHVVWFDDQEGAYDVLLASSSDGGTTFGAARRVDADEPGAAWSGWPRAHADADGRLVVVWEDARSGGIDVYARASTDGGATLGPEVRIDGGDAPGAHDSFAPTIAADGATVYVVWHDARGGERRDVMANWSVNFGQNWATDAVRVETDDAGSHDSISPSVVVRGTEATIAWQDARASAYDVFVRSLDSGWGPDPEARMDNDSPGAGNSLRPRVLRDGDTVVVLWQDRRDDDGSGYEDLYYRYSLDAGDTWSEDELRIDSLEPGTSYKRGVQAVLDDGTLFAVWEDGRRGNSDIWFQALPVGEGAEYLR